MEFELSEELIHQLIFAMENQNERFFLNPADLSLVPSKEKNEKLYPLPKWDSLLGFKMRERFVLLLRNPQMQTNLREILCSGNSVFKKFKETLKENPKIEKLWQNFKEREMRSVIIDWYNTLREVWGLEKIGAEPDENTELVEEDFVFRVFDSKKDQESLLIAEQGMLHECETIYDSQIGEVIALLWQNRRALSNEKNEFAIVCETVSGEFAGCISACIPAQNSKNVALLTLWYTISAYRGLGVGKQLLQECIRLLKKNQVQRLVLENFTTSQYIISVLFRCGFKQAGLGFIAAI